MSAAPMTFGEARALARRERRAVIGPVLMANDEVRLVRFGPRGGWSFVPS